MFEVTYQEVNKRDEVVTKRKSFKTAAARDKFVERASQKMFKKIVKSIAAIKTENDRDECYWQIDRAFEEERISFEDHELLYGLAGMVEVA